MKNEPRALPTNVKFVLDRIERAFRDVKLGNGVSLRETEVVDGYGTDDERELARRRDELKDWRKIPDAALATHFALSFFDDRGLVFHLPAYMSFALRNFRETSSLSVDFTIYALGGSAGRHQELLDLFTGPQKAAIRHFLKFMAYNAPRYCDAPRAIKALNRVWRVRRRISGE